jgi:CheY-like chemotaxis protein
MNAVNSSNLIQARLGLALRVLVVDDDLSTREILSTALGLFGADVKNACCVADARDLLLGWQPDLLISDLGMPDEDGYDLIRQLRALPPEQGGMMPAIALTGFTRTENQSLALAAGFNEVVTKPADLEDLLTVIRRVTLAQ